MNNRVVLFLFCFFITSVLFAQQYFIKGHVHSKNGYPITFATVTLSQNDSLYVNPIYTDSLGNFVMKQKAGNYNLTISLFGSESISKRIILKEDLNVGDLILDESVVLNEISIKATKKMFERKTDRLIFNVGQSTSSSASNALETLAKTPLVSVGGQGEIAIVGKNKVGILINDKLVYVSGNELYSLLNGIRSENIERIEVITTPPAKYDAQGNSGLINIVLKDNEALGFSSLFTSAAEQATYTSLSNNIKLDYNTNKLQSSFSFRQYYKSIKAMENYAIIGKQSLFSEEKRHDFYKGIGLEAMLNYKLTNRTKLGLVYNFNSALNDKDISNKTNFYDEESLYKDLFTTSKHDNQAPVHTINIYSQSTLSEEGDHMEIGVNYFDTASKSNVDFITNNAIKPNLADIVHNGSTINYNILSSTIDFVFNKTWSTLSFGSKYVAMRNSSQVEYFNLTDGISIVDPDKSNEFVYKEYNYASYVDLTKTLFKSWVFKLGFRYEYTATKGTSKTNQSKNTSSYSHLFPSVHISHKANDVHVFYFSYSKRINRPNFKEMDSFRWYSNPYSYSTGNPLLLPSYNHNFELGYLYHNFLSVDVYYQRLRNEFGQISTLNADTEVSSYYNYYNQENLGINVVYSRPLFYFLENSISLNVAYVKAQPKIENIIGEKGFASSYYVNNTFIIKPEHFFFLLNYWQRLPSKKGNTTLRNMASLDIGLKFLFLDKKLSFNIVANDLFQQLRAKGEKKFQGNYQLYNNYYDSRSVSFSATYNLGQAKNSKKNKIIDFEETSRAN